MTVEELIEELLKVEDKTKLIKIGGVRKGKVAKGRDLDKVIDIASATTILWWKTND